MKMDSDGKREKKYKFRLGITHGDINGIGYEIIIKALADQRILELFTPVVFGHSKVASYHRKSVNINEFLFQTVKNAESAINKKVNLVNCYDGEVKIDLGKTSQIAGKLAFYALEKAVNELKNNTIDAVITAPINKENIQSDTFKFPGHTEYFAEKFEVEDFMMLMIHEKLRIGIVTGHIPVKDISSDLNEDVLKRKINILNESLIRDFNIQKPKIAVLGLNPHAGENGLLGNEEETIIIPVIKKIFDEGILVYGPYPADGFFGSNLYLQFDGILAMYHDQGMIPFKTIAFDKGVNYTAGLPIVRTSPAHGTAYNIAGKNIASHESMRSAIYLALDIIRNRRQFDEMNKDPLPILLEAENNKKEADKNNND